VRQHHSYAAPARRAQAGAALVVSLIALLLMTIIGVTAASSSSLELLIATNTQNAGEALAMAEDSVLAGELYVQTTHPGGGPTFDFSAAADDGYYVAGEVDVQNVDWSAIETEQAFDGGGSLLTEYVVEYLGTTSASGGTLAAGTGGGAGVRHLYRISGRGVSARGTVRLVQTIYATD
jgi:type IV pilus assembly protein PilX